MSFRALAVIARALFFRARPYLLSFDKRFLHFLPRITHASLFRRLSRVEFAGQLLHCAENVELRSLVVWLFLALFEICFGSHIVGHITPLVQ
jgi:hypothetical protein